MHYMRSTHSLRDCVWRYKIAFHSDSITQSCANSQWTLITQATQQQYIRSRSLVVIVFPVCFRLRRLLNNIFIVPSDFGHQNVRII